jgi:hypothetical protein
VTSCASIAAVRAAQRREDKRGASRRVEVAGDLGGFVGRVLGVLVERRRPRRLLRRHVELDRSNEATHRRQYRSRDLADRPVWRQPHPLATPVAMLHHGLVRMQIQRDDERSRPIGGRQRERLPATRSEAKRRVLELRLGRRQHHGKLA